MNVDHTGGSFRSSFLQKCSNSRYLIRIFYLLGKCLFYNL